MYLQSPHHWITSTSPWIQKKEREYIDLSKCWAVFLELQGARSLTLQLEFDSLFNFNLQFVFQLFAGDYLIFAWRIIVFLSFLAPSASFTLKTHRALLPQTRAVFCAAHRLSLTAQLCHGDRRLKLVSLFQDHNRAEYEFRVMQKTMRLEHSTPKVKSDSTHSNPLIFDTFSFSPSIWDFLLLSFTTWCVFVAITHFFFVASFL